MTGDDGLVLAGMAVLIALLLHWLPLWRRQSLWFGVTVSPGFSETVEGRRALMRYRLWGWTLSVVAVACLLAGAEWHVPALFPIALFGQIVGASVSFAIVRLRILPFAVAPSGVRLADMSAAPEGLPGGLAAVLIPLGMLAATAAYLCVRWDSLAERFPNHWSIDGTPNGWAMRTWQGVFGPLVICAALSIFMLVMAEIIIHATPRECGTGTEAWTVRFRRATLRLLVVGVWSISAMMCVISLLPLFGGARPPAWTIAILPFIVIATMLPFVIQLVRLTRDSSSGSDGTPDRCWKLGQIYYNPDDPAIMVEKRFGLGYTLNFGHRGVVLVLGAAILVFGLIRVLIGSR